MLMTETTGRESAQALSADTISSYPMVLFMKGTPARPQCGFSAAVMDVLQHYDVPVHTIDVLADPAFRQAIKTYSGWPTIPQLYLNCTFLGGFRVSWVMDAIGQLAEVVTDMREEVRAFDCPPPSMPGSAPD